MSWKTFISLLTFSYTALAVYSFNPLHHLSGIAPYFEPSSPPLDPKPPQGCNVTRASYLVRHAAIYANDFDYEEYIEPFVQKLGNTSVDWSKAGPLRFLAGWRTPISDTDLEELTKVGELEAFQLGVDVGLRYRELSPPNKVWTSTAERTVKSADSFLSGLVERRNETELVTVAETKEEGADSLTPHQGCPAYSSSAGSKEASVCTFCAWVVSTSVCADVSGSNTRPYTRNQSSSASTTLLQHSISPKTTLSACKSSAATRL